MTLTLTQSRYTHYLWKSLKWTVGNAIFGLTPLLFMCLVYTIGLEKADHEIEHLILDGVIVFVSCAIMGAVLVDFALTDYRLTSGGVFMIYMFPCFIVGVVCLNYLFIHLKSVPVERFNLSSPVTISVVILSFFYCLFVKTRLYINELNQKYHVDV
jgi:hypothetical protein